MALKLNEKIIAVIQQVAANKGSRFVSLLYRSKESGELARHVILIGFSYHAAVERSLASLKKARFSDPVKKQAQGELIASFEKTLTSHSQGKQNADYTKGAVYDDVVLDGETVNGIKYNTNDNSFKLFGLTVGKTILENGVFKTVKSAPLTLAKNALRRKLPIGKFREYAIEENALAVAKINGNTLEM